jgi:hypothetical protein
MYEKTLSTPPSDSALRRLRAAVNRCEARASRGSGSVITSCVFAACGCEYLNCAITSPNANRHRNCHTNPYTDKHTDSNADTGALALCSAWRHANGRA